MPAVAAGRGLPRSVREVVLIGHGRRGGADRAPGDHGCLGVVNASADVEAYRRLAAAMEEWTAILRPGGWTRRPGELLDELADIARQSRCRHAADLAASPRASVRRELDP